MTTRYRLDPDQSRFTMQAFATGLLSFAGHSPTFAVRHFQGVVRFEDVEEEDMAIELTVPVAGLELVGNFSASDRNEIVNRMRRDVLEMAAHPEVSYQADDIAVAPIAPGRSRLRIVGPLALHGVTRTHPVDAEMQALDDAVRLLGKCSLRLSDYRISPVTALGGTIRLKDELAMTFDLIGLREGS